MYAQLGNYPLVFPYHLMDLQLLNKGLDLCKRKNKWVLLLALFGASSYGAYRVYHCPSVTRKKRRLLKLLTAVFSVMEMVSDSADTIGVLSKDLKEFLKSDSDEIPHSFRQMSKITNSDELSDSLSKISGALTVGIMKGYCSEVGNEGGSEGNVSVANCIMDRILSNSGTVFVSVVAGSFARNLVLGFHSNGESVDSAYGKVKERSSNGMDIPSVPSWVSMMFCDKCKDLMVNCIQVFVSTAVTVYLEKTLDINTYDELFSALTSPNNENKMKDILVSICNGAVGTFVKTSHQILTYEKMKSDTRSSHSVVNDGECANLDECGTVIGEKKAIQFVNRQVSGNIQNDEGWGGMVMSTLSAPGNRKFVLDVTGRVTFETVRSVVEFLHWKLYDGLKNSCDAVHGCVADRGRQVVGFFGLKSYLFLTICLALFLPLICGTRAMLPA